MIIIINQKNTRLRFNSLKIEPLENASTSDEKIDSRVA